MLVAARRGYAPLVPSIAELLARRVRSDGGAPLLTYYDTDDGVRTELSGTTFANWVAKTSNLLTDELLVSPGDAVELLVAARHPGHWMTLVWAQACWQTGLVVTLGRPAEARLVVCGPAYADVDPGDAELVACSLHPFGLGLEPPVPPGGGRLRRRGPRAAGRVERRPRRPGRAGLARPRTVPDPGGPADSAARRRLSGCWSVRARPGRPCGTRWSPRCGTAGRPSS